MASFSGFGAAAFDYLATLGATQDRDWYQANKPVLEREIAVPMRGFLAALSAEFERRGVPLSGDPKKSLFRMHRDTRFSKDKRPFKTHVGAVLSRPGTGKMSPGVLYLHLDPGECFLGAAFWQPDPDVLSSLREAIRVRPQSWREVLAALDRAGLTLDRADTLSRPPRGFEDAPADVAADLKLKSFIVHRPLARTACGSAALVGTAADFAESALPLLRFGWRAVDEVAGQVAEAGADRVTPAENPAGRPPARRR